MMESKFVPRLRNGFGWRPDATWEPPNGWCNSCTKSGICRRPEGNAVGTAFREMLLNAMEYGGKFQPNQYVEISYVRAKHMVMCRVKDPGEGFSLDEIGHAAIANPDEDPIRHVVQREAKGLRPGGYGVLLAQKLVDELIYNEKGNEVLLVKYVDRPGSAAVPASVS